MLDYVNPELVIDKKNITPGRIAWRSPSNLALVKYWGKYGRQLPRNPSISFTLNNAFTETILEYRPKENTTDGIALDFFFEKKANELFKNKVEKFLESIRDIFPFLNQLQITIHSYNSFPHSTGIASSASAMSALAACVCDLERSLFGTLTNENEFLQKVSFVARLGSGSASRSVYPHLAIWGASNAAEGASNLFAIPWGERVHPVFRTFRDTILIADRKEKSVSSRAGHGLMENNIFADNRYAQANQRFEKLLIALREGDLNAFGQITENEALTLHALMMTSEPSYILMRPNTLTMIEKIRSYRASTQQPLYFSLDAGPNIHLLYPDEIKEDVGAFIKAELEALCENKEWISDQVGTGAQRIKG
ncbi:MAG: diphosphomevalonate decarboxylase [Bacteroidota bacterium]